MKQTTLTRSVKRPLVFIGALTASATTKEHDSTRWVNVEVYETEAGMWIVGIARITCWQGERDSFSAEVFTAPEKVVDYIEEEVASVAPEIAEKLNILEEVK